MTTIDFHNHFYPPEYLEAVKEGPSSIKVTFDDDNNPLLHYPGDYNIVVPGHLEFHLTPMRWKIFEFPNNFRL